MVPDRTDDNPFSEAQFKTLEYRPTFPEHLERCPTRRRFPRKCGSNGTVFRFDGSPIHVAAHHNSAPEAVEVVRRAFPMAPGRGTV